MPWIARKSRASFNAPASHDAQGIEFDGDVFQDAASSLQPMIKDAVARHESEHNERFEDASETWTITQLSDIVRDKISIHRLLKARTEHISYQFCPKAPEGSQENADVKRTSSQFVPTKHVEESQKALASSSSDENADVYTGLNVFPNSELKKIIDGQYGVAVDIQTKEKMLVGFRNSATWQQAASELGRVLRCPQSGRSDENVRDGCHIRKVLGLVVHDFSNIILPDSTKVTRDFSESIFVNINGAGYIEGRRVYSTLLNNMIKLPLGVKGIQSINKQHEIVQFIMMMASVSFAAKFILRSVRNVMVQSDGLASHLRLGLETDIIRKLDVLITKWPTGYGLGVGVEIESFCRVHGPPKNQNKTVEEFESCGVIFVAQKLLVPLLSSHDELLNLELADLSLQGIEARVFLHGATVRDVQGRISLQSSLLENEQACRSLDCAKEINDSDIEVKLNDHALDQALRGTAAPDNNTQSIHETSQTSFKATGKVKEVSVPGYESINRHAECRHVFAWGKQDGGALGLGENFSEPTSSHLRPRLMKALGASRVTMLAASVQHTIILTDLGLVYTCGTSEEGALGQGRLITANSPRLVEWFLESENPIVIRCVGAGGGSEFVDEIDGSHSAAVSENGQIYCWGAGCAVGLGSLKSCDIPQRVKGALESRACVKVTCGSAFTVATTMDGTLYAWGRTSRGRLGVGKVAASRPAGMSRVRFRSHYLRFHLRPQRVVNLDNKVIQEVACGEEHCLAVDKEGNLYSWGRGSEGQLGSGFDADSFVPLKINLIDDDGNKAKFASAACGSRHSMAIDVKGRVWTWGGNGSFCLGHCDYIVTSKFRQLRKNSSLFLKGQGWMSRPDSSFCPWMRPRKLKYLSNSVVRVQGGAGHSAAITDDGMLFVWGDGAGGALGNGCENITALPTIYGQAQPPSSSSLASDSNTIVMENAIEDIFCNGRRSFAITAGPFIGRTLFQALQTSNWAKSLKAESADDWFTFKYFEDRTFTDLMLYAGGKGLRAHKLILAQRSPILKNLIIQEERPGRVVELMLSDLRYEVAQLLVEFLYCDNIYSAKLDPKSPLLADLLVAAERFGVDRLESWCQVVYRSFISPLGLEDTTGFMDAYFPPSKKEDLLTGSIATLADDLRGALGDYRWADVRFLADGKAVYAHKCILVMTSEYFRSLFQSGMRESQLKEDGDIPEIEVPDSYAAMLRIMSYLYTGRFVPPAEEENILEDLLMADRYGIPRLKLLCESNISIRKDNCIDLLCWAEMVNAALLMERATALLLTHLSEMSEHDNFQNLIKSNTKLSQYLAERIQEVNEPLTLAHTIARAAGENEEEEKKDPTEWILEQHGKAPITPALVLTCLFFSYAILTKIYPSIGFLVPYANGLIFLAMMAGGLVAIS